VLGPGLPQRGDLQVWLLLKRRVLQPRLPEARLARTQDELPKPKRLAPLTSRPDALAEPTMSDCFTRSVLRAQTRAYPTRTR
jgi:hypothetical protein